MIFIPEYENGQTKMYYTRVLENTENYPDFML